MKKVIIVVLALVLCFSVAGCTSLKKEADSRRSEREYCILNENDATAFTYAGTEYIILEEVIERDALGAWVGYIQKFALLDNQYAVLELREVDLSNASMSNLPDETVYGVQFFNIYCEKETEGQNLIIDVNGDFHKAIPKEQLNDTAIIISFKELNAVSDGSIAIHSEDCTQIVYADGTYQITEIETSESELDAYLGVIGAHRVFNANTNREILEGTLGKVEIVPGELSEQVRISWNNGAVYSINSIETSQLIAIKINDKYLRADVVQ